MSGSHHHRAGHLRQANKAHKAVHASKRRLDRAAGGKVNVAAGGARRSGGAGALAAHGKAQRANTAKQRRITQRQELQRRRRLGGGHGPPKIVCFVGLSATASAAEAADAVLRASDGAVESDSAQMLGRPVTVSFTAHKQRFTLLVARERNLQSVLDCAKVADVVVLCLSLAAGLDGVADDVTRLLSSGIRAQGLPAVVVMLQHAEALPARAGKEAVRECVTYAESEYGGADVKVLQSADAALLVRALATVRERPLQWRGNRSYLLAHAAAPTPGGGAVVSGFLRGRPFNVRQLVHIAGVGTFRVSKVTTPVDPCPLRPAAPGARVVPLREHGPTVAACDAGDAEPLDALAEVDAAAGEQAVITDADIAAADAARAHRVKVPKGMSDYMATWVDVPGEGGSVDEEGEEEEEGAGGGGGGGGGGAAMEDDGSGGSGSGDDDDEEGGSGSDDEEDGEAGAGEAAGGGGEEEMSVDEEGGEDAAGAAEARRAAERDDVMFPDEVDTPRDRPARYRFARYRGLRSFRGSPWDPKESLPRAYARTFALPQFALAKKLVLREAARAERALELAAERKRGAAIAPAAAAAAAGDVEMAAPQAAGGAAAALPAVGPGWVEAGQFVSLWLEGVDAAALGARDPAAPLVVGALLRYENRVSVLHFNVSRHGGCEDPIKSKEPLEFHVGWRKFSARPIYSTNEPLADKHKFERYFVHGRFSAASVYAPICFAPMPVLAFKVLPSGARQLVATGTVMSADPDRVVLKKIVLTGYPVKVKKRFAIVRGMFFAPDDIRWFKPIELWTKRGLSGHIREPVGTHGSMKAIFSGNIKNNDTVCMSLYKRVYPKDAEMDAE